MKNGYEMDESWKVNRISRETSDVETFTSRFRKQDALQKKKKLKLRMPPLSRAKRSEKEDAKSLASDMCPNGSSDAGFRTRDAVV